ncbi:MAG TPA: chemotaxis-specific protein-glutamate methyltransferase CheB [Solirubrobacteraceae bacterium]|nr:chemotaxis-specific protein-glutamate methyltransferase CheB [Solirubrobacteraceae bacterium]
MSALPSARVVVADDSALMRTVLSAALTQRGIEVVAVAADGDEALARCHEHSPDVLSLDLTMPGRDGVGVLRELRDRRLQIPVVVVSAFSAAAGARAVDALAEGAFDLVAKPTSREQVDAFAGDLVKRILLARGAGRRRAGVGSPDEERLVQTQPSPAQSSSPGGHRVVIIGCSTGGPRALSELLPKLPPRLGDGTLVIQHMPEGFTAALAARLDRVSQLTVSEAAAGQCLDPTRVLIAPGGKHLRVGTDGLITLTDEPAVGGLRPRADLTISDAAAVWGQRVLLVVLTGMGQDTLSGAAAVRKAGGRVIVEAPSSCVVHGMPRAVMEAGLADEEVDLSSMAEAILAEVSS